MLPPPQKQLRGDVGVDAPGEPLQILRSHHGVADKRAADQRGQREQVQDIVPVVGGEDRSLVAHSKDVAQGVLLASEHLHGLAVGHHIDTRERRDRDPIAVREAAQQLAIQFDLAHQIGLGQCLARSRQKRHGEQVDGCDRGG